MLWSLTDVSGSVIAQAQAGEIAELSDYDDWGNQDFASAGWSSGFNFTGELTDPALGVNLYYARTYDPATAVFTSLDPVRGLLDAPQSLNRYGYVLNNPMSAVDLYGYWPDWLSDAWNSTTKWMGENKTALLVGAVVIVAGAACIGLTMGACTPLATSGGAALTGSVIAVPTATVVTSAVVSGATAGAVVSSGLYLAGNQGNYSWNDYSRQVSKETLVGAVSGAGTGWAITRGLGAIRSPLPATHPQIRPAVGSSGKTVPKPTTSKPGGLPTPPTGQPPKIAIGSLKKHVPGTNEWRTATNKARAYDVAKAKSGHPGAFRDAYNSERFKSLFFGQVSATKITQMAVKYGKPTSINERIWTSPVAIGYSEFGVPLYKVKAVYSGKGWHAFPIR